MRSISSLPLLLCLFLLGGRVAQADLIQNGDFENLTAGVYAGWDIPVTEGGWTWNYNAGIVAGAGNPAAGNSVALESSGGPTADPTIAQTVSGLTIGATYSLGWDLAMKVNWSGSGTGRSFGVFLDNQTFGDAIFFDEHLLANYISQSVDFTATGTSHTIIFAGELDDRTNGGVGKTDVSYRLDNVTLMSAVPEPSTLALALTGAMVFLPWLWRRRSKG